MDNQPIKKKAEQELIRQFKSIYSDFPKGKIVSSESPDFILKITRKKAIGIELIQLFSPKGKTAKEEFTRENFIKNLKHALAKKEEKLRLYQKNILGNYWLLISTESLRSASFNIHNLIEKIDFESSFDKVFLFDSTSEKIYYLK